MGALAPPTGSLGFSPVCDSCHKPLLPSSILLLPSCRHVFCRVCLEDWLPPYSLTLICPVCFDQYIVPREGLKAFEPRMEGDGSGGRDSGVDTNTTQHDISLHIPTCRHCGSGDDVRFRCRSCYDLPICANCQIEHSRMDDNHAIVEVPDPLSPGEWTATSSSLATGSWPCSRHTNRELRLYCGNCVALLCDDCVETSYNHSSHVVILLKDALLQQKASLHSLLGQLKEKMSELEAKSKNERLVTSLKDCFIDLLIALKKRRQVMEESFEQSPSLLAREQEFYRRRIQEILDQCELAESQICSTNSNKESVGGGTMNSLSSVFRDVSEQLQAFLKSQESVSEASSDDDRSAVLFYPSYLKTLHDLVQKIETLDVEGGEGAKEVEAFATGEGLRYCCKGRRTLVILTTKSHAGRPLDVSEDDIDAEVHSKNEDNALEVDVQRTDSGAYDLSYQLTKEGVYVLSIRIFDRPICGSPFSIHCVSESEYRVDHCSIHSKSASSVHSRRSRLSSPRSSTGDSGPKFDSTNRTAFGTVEDDLLLKVGRRGRAKGCFTNPQDICCLPDGRMAISDSNNINVQIFSDEGGCGVKFGQQGREPGMFRRPTGVVALNEDRLLVADYDNKLVNIFDTNGRFVHRFGMGKLLGPKGVAVDSDGRIIVVDNRTSSIVFFNVQGKLLHKFGSRGDKPNQLAGPHFVALGQNRWLYVSDFHHHCVKVFDPSGTHIFSFGSNGVGNGQFNAPTGIAIDRQSNVLVADWGNNRIQVFDANGSFLSFVNSMADPIFGPQGLGITADGHVAVADSGNHCYKIYRFLA